MAATGRGAPSGLRAPPSSGSKTKPAAWRRPRRPWVAIGLLAAAAAAGWILTAPRPAFAPDDPAIADGGGDAGRGRLVFAAGDCASCHASPGQSDRLRLGGGLALASPYGTLYVPDISQDPVDGIGRWRTVDLANAMMSGVSPASQHNYPAFSYVGYARAQPSDVVDLMAYLRTLPPVPGRPPPHELAFPLNIRRLVGVWKLLYLDRSPLAPVAGRSAQWHRGRYLVETLAHCAECHSSRNVMGGIKPDTRFAGGRDPEGTASRRTLRRMACRYRYTATTSANPVPSISM